MGEKEAKKCTKCGSDSISKKNVRLPGSAAFFNPLEATAYICDKCGYVELYCR